MENYIKTGGKGIKNASFWAIISKKFAGSTDPPARELGKKMNKGKNKGEKYIKRD